MRYEDWPNKLGEAIERMDRLGFSWGKHDCCLAVFDVVFAITGVNPGERFRGKYSLPWQAARLTRNMFGGSVEAAAECLAAAYRFPEISPLFAHRGDVVLVPSELGYGLGIVDTTGKWIAVATNTNNKRLPLKWGKRAWRT